MAKLAIYDTQDAIPDALRDVYVERDGKWYPDAPDLYESGRAAIEAERRTARDAKKKADEALKALKAAQAELEEARAHAPSTGENSAGTDHAAQLAQMKKQFEEFRKALEQKAAESEKRAADLVLRDQQRTIADALRNAALEAGVRKEAVNDLISLSRFKDAWRITEDGDLMAYEGEAPILDPVTAKPISTSAYTQKFVQDKPNEHWLAPSAGSGAQGSAPPRTGSVITVRKADMRDATAWQQVQDEAKKRGAVVQYTE